MEFGSGSYSQASVFLIHKLGTLSTYPKGQHIAFLYSRSPTPNRTFPALDDGSSQETLFGWPRPLFPVKNCLKQVVNIREAKLDSDIGCEFRPPDTEPKIDHYVMFQ